MNAGGPPLTREGCPRRTVVCVARFFGFVPELAHALVLLFGAPVHDGQGVD